MTTWNRLCATIDLDAACLVGCAAALSFSCRNRSAAQRAVKAIRGGVRTLTDQPHIGRPIEGMDMGYREWLIDFGTGGYSVLYRIEGDIVAVLAVRHQREAGY